MRLAFLFILLSLAVSSCSRKSDKQLFTEAQAAATQEDFKLAIDRYTEIVNRHPEGEYAESSQYRIAAIYNNDLHDHQKALESYRRFCALYPRSKDAPTALFLTGFLLNNELHQLDSARAVYEAFLQKYPGHELATSARFELETLGKDPTQFLRSQVAAADSQEPKPKANGSKR